MVMYRSLFLLLFVFSAAVDTVAADVLLRGYAPEFAGKQFHVHYPADFLSQVPIPLGEFMVDDSGYFSTTLFLPQTTKITVASEAWFSDFYVESGKSYTIRLFKPKNPTARAFDQNRLGLAFENLSQDDPNALMDFFYRRHDDLISAVELELAVHLGKGSREALKPDSASNDLDSMSVTARFQQLKKSCEERLGPSSDIYTGELLQAALGRLALTLGEDKHAVYNSYMQKSPDLGNPEFVALFAQMHAQILNQPGIQSSALLSALEAGQLSDAMSSITADYTLLSSDIERELALIFIIHEQWYTSPGMRKGSQRIMELLEQNSEFWGALNGRIRTSLLRGTTQAENFLPAISLAGLDEERLDLRSLDGELVYLNVVSIASAASQRELLTLEPVVRKFGNQVRFITIVIDDDMEKIRQYLGANRNQNWTFLLGGMHPELRYHLRLRSVPSFYLIDPNGRLMFERTLAPSEGIHDTFVRILK